MRPERDSRTPAPRLQYAKGRTKTDGKGPEYQGAHPTPPAIHQNRDRAPASFPS